MSFQLARREGFKFRFRFKYTLSRRARAGGYILVKPLYRPGIAP